MAIAEVNEAIVGVQEAIAEVKEAISEQKEAIANLENFVKKMRPVLKQYVRRRGLALINEFITIISQVHKCGMHKKFNKARETDKFGPLDHNVAFQLNCQLFLNLHQDPKVITPAHISKMFTTLGNKRNFGVHYEEPEDCLLHIQKFGKKHADLLKKCAIEVRYCVPRIVSIAKHFLGPYRLSRLTCQFIARVLISHGFVWKDMEELAAVLSNNRGCINFFMPEGCLFEDFKERILDIFKSSKLHGPRWNGTSRDDSGDYLSIQVSFKKCKDLGILPPKFPMHIVEYSILEYTW